VVSTVPLPLKILSGILVAIIVVLLVDTGVGYVMYSRDPKFTPYDEHKPNTIIMFVGFPNSGTAAARTLGPKLRQVANLVVVDYPEQGFSTKPIYLGLRQHLKAAGLDRTQISFYGGSMGGEVVGDMLRYMRADHMPYGKIDTVVLDSAISGGHSMKAPSWLFKVVKYVPGGPLLTHILAPFVERQVAPAINAAESQDPAFLRDLKKHYRAMATNPWPSTRSEMNYMASYQLRMGEFEFAGLARRVFYVTSEWPEDDSLVHADVARADWDSAFGGQVVYVIDPNRGRDEHNTAVERPTFIADTFAKSFDRVA
jgi:pimeloyl-ACP methyl ester carboxylesterase